MRRIIVWDEEEEKDNYHKHGGDIEKDVGHRR